MTICQCGEECDGPQCLACEEFLRVVEPLMHLYREKQYHRWAYQELHAVSTELEQRKRAAKAFLQGPPWSQSFGALAPSLFGKP